MNMDLTVFFIILGTLSIVVTVISNDSFRNRLKRELSIIFFLFTRRKFLNEMEILGIKRIYRTRTETEMENPYFSLDISTKLHSVKAMGISLAGIKNFGDARIRYHLKNDCKFEFLLLDPDSDFLKQRAYQENPNIKGETEGFIDWIKGTFSSSEYKKQIKVLTYDLMPTMAITVINDNLLFVNPYSLLRRNQEFPVIGIGKGGSLFSLYEKEYENVLGHEKTKQIFP